MPAAAKSAQRQRKEPTTAQALALKPAALTPAVPLAKAQKAAQDLRADYPTLSDETVALCVLHLTTRKSLAAVARDLGVDKSWAYARIARPETQAFLGQLAMSLLGVAAARSIRTLEQLRDSSPDEAMRFKAAVELADRAGLGNTRDARTNGTAQPFMFTFGERPKG
jgi:transposase-like protein